jgi:hypothetical protein
MDGARSSMIHARSSVGKLEPAFHKFKLEIDLGAQPRGAENTSNRRVPSRDGSGQRHAASRSISWAADALHVTQPAVTRPIRDPEIETARTLFQRKGNRLYSAADANQRYAEVERAFVGLSRVDEFARDLPSIHARPDDAEGGGVLYDSAFAIERRHDRRLAHGDASGGSLAALAPQPANE